MENQEAFATRRNFLASGGVALASLALIPLSDCSGSAGGSVLTPPASLTMKPPFHSEWQNDGAYALLDANGRSVVTVRKVGASTVLGTSSFAEPRSVELQKAIAIGAQANVGSGITVYRSGEHAWSWTGLDGNDGTYMRQGNQAFVYMARFAKSTGNSHPIAVLDPPNLPVRTPQDWASCAIAAVGLGAAAIGVIAAFGAAGSEVGLNPVADIALYAAVVGFGAAFAAFTQECL